MFAQATYATPIEFEISDPGGTIYVHEVQVALADGTQTILVTDGLSDRHSSGDGLGDEQEINSSERFTLFLSADEYSNVQIPNDRTDKATFAVKAIVSKTEDGPKWRTTFSSSSDEDAKPKVFADTTVTAFDIPESDEDEHFPSLITDTGAGHYHQLKDGSLASPHAAPAPVSHDYVVGFGGFDEAGFSRTTSATGIELDTTLIDLIGPIDDPNGDPPGSEGNVIMVSHTGETRISSWYISYGGTVVNWLGETTMDLSKISGNMDVNGFAAGNASISSEVTELDYNGFTASVFALGWALTAPWSVGWSAALGAASVVADYFSGAVPLSSADQGGGAVVGVLSRATENNVTAEFWEQDPLLVSGSKTMELSKNGKSVNVGDQWSAYVTVSAFSVGESTADSTLGFDHEILANAKYTVSSANNWNKVEVVLHPNSA